MPGLTLPVLIISMFFVISGAESVSVIKDFKPGDTLKLVCNASSDHFTSATEITIAWKMIEPLKDTLTMWVSVLKKGKKEVDTDHYDKQVFLDDKGQSVVKASDIKWAKNSVSQSMEIKAYKVHYAYTEFRCLVSTRDDNKKLVTRHSARYVVTQPSLLETITLQILNESQKYSEGMEVSVNCKSLLAAAGYLSVLVSGEAKKVCLVDDGTFRSTLTTCTLSTALKPGPNSFACVHQVTDPESSEMLFEVLSPNTTKQATKLANTSTTNADQEINTDNLLIPADNEGGIFVSHETLDTNFQILILAVGTLTIMLIILIIVTYFITQRKKGKDKGKDKKKEKSKGKKKKSKKKKKK